MALDVYVVDDDDKDPAAGFPSCAMEDQVHVQLTPKTDGPAASRLDPDTTYILRELHQRKIYATTNCSDFTGR